MVNIDMYVKSYLCKSVGRVSISSAMMASISEYAKAASVNLMKCSWVIVFLSFDQHFLIFFICVY